MAPWRRVGWLRSRPSSASPLVNLRARAERPAALLAPARIAGAGGYSNCRSSGEAAVNAATITMDGLTTPENPARFARTSRARTVEAVSDDEDAQLMLAYARGEMRAFETLYSRHRGALYRYLMRQARDGEVANDLFQEVWSRVIVNRARYEPRAKFRTFLFTLAHNCFIDHCRRTKARPGGMGIEDADAADLLPARRGIAARLGAGARRGIVADIARRSRRCRPSSATSIYCTRNRICRSRKSRGSPGSAPRRRRAGCATR